MLLSAGPGNWGVPLSWGVQEQKQLHCYYRVIKTLTLLFPCTLRFKLGLYKPSLKYPKVMVP